ncbi:MAG: holin [Roseburia sp.]|jgi:hypothetical protein|nr:MAG TPA: holin [Caudoviricetes sp.]
MFKNCVLKPSVSTKEWFKRAGIRAVKTMAQTAGGMLVIGAFNETAWSILIQTTIVTGIASMLTSIAGLPECEECKEE